MRKSLINFAFHIKFLPYIVVCFECLNFVNPICLLHIKANGGVLLSSPTFFILFCNERTLAIDLKDRFNNVNIILTTFTCVEYLVYAEFC